jgi:hypothetical protein
VELMHVYDFGSGGRWFVVARHYPTALMAKAAWERANRKLILQQREQGIGVQRLAPADDNDPHNIPSGAPDGVHGVVAVALIENLARRAERLLRDGTDWTPPEDFARALILRHARVGAAMGAGKNVIRRPEGRGGRLTEQGVLYESEPGRG